MKQDNHNPEHNSPKSPKQLYKFILHNSFKTEDDFRLVIAFCKTQGAKKLSTLQCKCSDDGVTATEFMEWYKHGFVVGDVVEYDGMTGIVENSHFKAPLIDFIVKNDKVAIQPLETPSERLKIASKEKTERFLAQFFSLGYQYDAKECCIAHRYIPAKNEPVFFTNPQKSGVGIVRNIELESGEVEFYCCYILEADVIAYSMHVKGVVNIHDTFFRPIPSLEEGKDTGVYSLRKMQERLASHGKVWRQALKRVEPLELQDYTGEYWYLDDRFRVCKGKCGPTSRIAKARKIHGNFFMDYKTAVDYAAEVIELRKDWLAGNKRRRIPEK